MKVCARLVLHLCGLLLVLPAGVGANNANGASVEGLLNIGAAEIDITPPVGHRMAGYFDERFATGTHDPLKAKAIVMQQRGEEIALVFCDLIGPSLPVTSKARELASESTGIPGKNIVIAATHSHTGPLFDDVRRDYFHQLAVEKNGTDAAEKVYYPDLLVDRLVKVITQARQNLRPATLETGIAKQENLAFNRRYWMRNGKVVFNPGQMNTNIVRPAGPTDPEVGILLARDWQSGKPFAGLTVFAMHLDTAGGTEYSADYAFYLQEGLRKKFGPSYISAFGAGTCGDLNHINVNKKETTKGFEAAERIGSTLAETVLKASEHLDSVSKPSLSVRNTVLEIQLQRVSPEAVADAKSKVNKLGDPNTDFTSKVVLAKTLDLAARGPTIPMEVQVFRLDPDTAIVCLPGEIFVELGLAIKRGSPFKNTMVISICNDRPNYVPTLKAFSEGSYEVTNSRVQPGTGEQLVEAAITLLKDLKE